MQTCKRMDRREAIKWVLAASAILCLPGRAGTPALRARASAAGYGHDPNLLESYKPGDLWPLTFTPEQHRTAAALCDIILPADERSPRASELKVPDFIDEWISAPYPRQQRDRRQVLAGLAWLDAESQRRFRKRFAELTDPQKRSICDAICSRKRARPRYRRAADFFATFRNLTMSGFYTTPAGTKDIQYLGNTPLMKFDGPPPEVLAFLKLQ